MKVKEFVDLINSLDCEEFSDIPEKDVEFIKASVGEKWSFDDTYSTSMNVYKCEDGYAGVIGVNHLDEEYFDRCPNDLHKLPHCIACEVTLVNVPTFIPNPNKVYTDFVSKTNTPL